jgi:hypothetical protein
LSRFLDEGFVERFVGLLGDEAFADNARWFDGAIALQDDQSQVWLKLYGGHVVDVRPLTPPTGATVTVRGPDAAWDTLAAGERQIMDLLLAGRRAPDISLAELRGDVLPHPGAFQLEGEGMTALRLTETIYRLLAAYRDAAVREALG